MAKCWEIAETQKRSRLVSLEPGEHLSVVTFSDGGFDISSAVIEGPDEEFNRSSLAVNSNLVIQQESYFYPNPSSNRINLKVSSSLNNEQVAVTAYDVMGRDLGEVYVGALIKGINTINDIDISGLPKGLLMLKVKVGTNITSHKITVQ